QRLTARALHRDEFDAGEQAEDPPRRGVVTEVHHLVVRPARGQPSVQALAQPGGRPELAVGHLQRRQRRAVPVLPLRHHQPAPTRRNGPPSRLTGVAIVAGPGWYWNRNVGGSASRPMPSGRLISRTGRSERATFQLPSPMWLISTESEGKSIAYISVKWASPI